jgi:hypothetical protein
VDEEVGEVQRRLRRGEGVGVEQPEPAVGDEELPVVQVAVGGTEHGRSALEQRRETRVHHTLRQATSGHGTRDPAQGDLDLGCGVVDRQPVGVGAGHPDQHRGHLAPGLAPGDRGARCQRQRRDPGHRGELDPVVSDPEHLGDVREPGNQLRERLVPPRHQPGTAGSDHLDVASRGEPDHRAPTWTMCEQLGTVTDERRQAGELAVGPVGLEHQTLIVAGARTRRSTELASGVGLGGEPLTDDRATVRPLQLQRADVRRAWPGSPQWPRGTIDEEPVRHLHATPDSVHAPSASRTIRVIV